MWRHEWHHSLLGLQITKSDTDTGNLMDSHPGDFKWSFWSCCMGFCGYTYLNTYNQGCFPTLHSFKSYHTLQFSVSASLHPGKYVFPSSSTHSHCSTVTHSPSMFSYMLSGHRHCSKQFSGSEHTDSCCRDISRQVSGEWQVSLRCSSQGFRSSWLFVQFPEYEKKVCETYLLDLKIKESSHIMCSL